VSLASLANSPSTPSKPVPSAFQTPSSKPGSPRSKRSRFRLIALEKLALKLRLNDAPVSISLPLLTQIDPSLRFECKSTLGESLPCYYSLDIGRQICLRLTVNLRRITEFCPELDVNAPHNLVESTVNCSLTPTFRPHSAGAGVECSSLANSFVGAPRRCESISSHSPHIHIEYSLNGASGSCTGSS
jgi:hypothetical protein